ncbi:Single-stranded DNA-binding protein B [Jeotgalibaca dankookensis]|uniref:Single-stranded DNA-binding protein n=1 Tax=Jeotgalibaca dankookensis TaxID=708126 RepID=A0A1S6ILM7_9LACT|nr:single-stranded DNA-binding protein [Jeotgalibaca dankookensis]AQS52446.1 Single-stranded DNA-binding protein B [Jeotgalibaca dankookensis]
MNHVSLIGRLVRPVELQEVGHGSVVCNNTLAVRNAKKNENGQALADFIPLVFWDKTALLLRDYCAKGNQIGVTGRMVSRSYVNKNEQTVYIVELLVEDLYFMEAKKISNQATNTNPEPIEIPF